MSLGLVALFTGQGNTFSISRTLYTLTGDLAAAYFLGECVFWSDWAEREGRTELHRAGWFYRTHAEWEAETGLKEDVVKRVKGVCLAYGLRYERKGIPAKGHYKVDGAHLTELLTMLADGAELEAVRERGAALYDAYAESGGADNAGVAPVRGKTPNKSGAIPDRGKAPDWGGGTPLTSSTETPLSNNNSNTTPTQPKQKTPPTPQGGSIPSGDLEGQEGTSGERPASPVTSGNAQGTEAKQSAGTAKGSAGAGRKSGAKAKTPEPELPAEDLRGLIALYNDHAGPLPKVAELNPGRVKGLCRLWRECGYDLEKARALIADATREVAIDDFWTASRRYGFDNLLPKVWGRAEAWRNRQDNPAPLEVGGARPPRRDMTQAQAVAAASQNAAHMLTYLED